MYQFVENYSVNDNTIGAKAVDPYFCIVNTEICTDEHILLHSFDMEHFAEISFQTYDKKKEMTQLFKDIMTQDKLNQLFHSQTTEQDFDFIIKEIFKLEPEE